MTGRGWEKASRGVARGRPRPAGSARPAAAGVAVSELGTVVQPRTWRTNTGGRVATAISTYMGSRLGEGEECECEWERLEEDATWKDNAMYLTVNPISSWEQCELVCCYRHLGCAGYTYTAHDVTCKVWVSLEGACSSTSPRQS